MPKSYDDCYEHLAQAQAKLGELAEARGIQERYACVRVAFHHLNQAVRIAGMCHEASGFQGAEAQGGSYARARDGMEVFSRGARNCRELLGADDATLLATCAQWLDSAKAYVDRTRADEARTTNLQYARMPEQQDYSIICKEGRSWKGSRDGSRI